MNALAPFPHPPMAARAGITRLTALDPDFARIEPAAGPLPWRTRAPGFPAFLSAIVGQQISNQAAAAIWGRLSAIPGSTTPEGLLRLRDEELRVAGLSRPKITHVRAVAEAFVAGVLAEQSLAAMEDAAAIAAISGVRGLGPWSAEIYLLFALQRPDVFPAGDLALQAAYAHLKNLPARPAAAALRLAAAPWAPHRALAARLLWHWWRHVTGRPSLDDEKPTPLPSAAPPQKARRKDASASLQR
ncbi:MAG TPA: DNA-3-methyladenine glycosylase 2 family protein [Acetobacteraceae bacterium]|nr:DNA-3-methyladenine glycosylase 2 family protein [Acetobacteraceae bacterium]